MPTSRPNDFGTTLPDAAHQDATLKARSQRFLIQAPLLYRERGETAWNEGTTVNISRSGVLFRTAKELKVRTVLEMRILFPAGLTRGVPATIRCYGPVRRTEPFLAAAAILHYCFKCLTSD